MAEQGVLRASHEEVESFVMTLRVFHGFLSESEQAMLQTILESAQSQETGAYGIKSYDWSGLVGVLTEGDDTQGFAARGL